MKKLPIVSVLLIAATCLLAQVPEKMSYQAVIRDSGGALVANSKVGMQISILQGSASGTPLYVETQAPETNENGLVSIEIGGGDPVVGSFPAIDWSAGPFFIMTEADPAGGVNYTISGTSQVLSVPFALHAKFAENIDFTEADGSVTNEIQSLTKSGLIVTLSHDGGSVTDSVNNYTAGKGIEINGLNIGLEEKLEIGDIHMGGIIFFLDQSGEHGLVASLDDLDGGEGVPYSDVMDQEIGEAARSATDGKSNTDAMIAQQVATSAAQLCRDLGPEWYLPSNRELYLLFTHEILIDQILDNDGDPATNGLIQERFSPTFSRYWSSTEQDDVNAWNYKAPSGDTSPYLKSSTYRVRAIRAF